MYARPLLAFVSAAALVVSCTSEEAQGPGSDLTASSSGGSSGGGSSSSGGGTSSGGSTSSGGDASTPTPTPPGAEPSDPALRGIVAAHNAVRAAVTPAAATPIPNLSWSDTDAAVAKAWAAQCKFEHNPGRGNRGENIYAAGGSGSSTPQKVVGSWASEKSNYNYANNSCSGVCGHYTQVVWAKTTTLGCAAQKCSGAGGPFGSGPWELWVCDYSPPGNYNGQRPY